MSEADFRPPEGHRRLNLTLSYCGTPWLGWQAQPGGGAVQNELNSAIERLTKLKSVTEGASRTDAGVHALAQTVHVDVLEALRMENPTLRRGLNGVLPESIRVTDVAAAPERFHASLSSRGKTYRYRIWRAEAMNPFEADRAWHVPGTLDLDALRDGAGMLQGTHNFVRLSANPGEASDEDRRRDIEGHTRTLERVHVQEIGEVLEIELEGDAFLYHMARLCVGALVQIARGRASLEWLQDLLATPHGMQNHTLAPAGGLYLARVKY